MLSEADLGVIAWYGVNDPENPSEDWTRCTEEFDVEIDANFETMYAAMVTLGWDPAYEPDGPEGWEEPGTLR